MWSKFSTLSFFIIFVAALVGGALGQLAVCFTIYLFAGECGGINWSVTLAMAFGAGVVGAALVEFSK